jgi:pyridoxine 5-phosphate synthase
MGFDAVELWTAGYTDAKSEPARNRALTDLAAGLELGIEHGLWVYGGHGLTYRNIGPVAAMYGFSEFNIGHSIVARSLFAGMREAVREMKRLIELHASQSAALDAAGP